jgi:hypothetical protein
MEHNQSNIGLDQCHDCGVRRKQVANPTTNYGFVLPTPTDLVTDLPADFDVALQGVDTRLKALQPGTTLGDLAYSSATANTNTRLPIGTTGQVLAVVGGVPAWATTADQTPLTTKGDIFTFTTEDARLGVGANGTVLTADSAEATGLKWATPSSGSSNVAGKNGVLNSAMNVWQRGTSIAGVAGANTYTADRWALYQAGSGTQITVSRQLTNDTTNLPNIQYCARVQRNSGSTYTNAKYLFQSFETINSIPFAGTTVTLSYYARKGADFTDGSPAFNVSIQTGTGTDQNWLTGYTGNAVAVTSTPTLTTTWQRFTATGTIAASATELAVVVDNRGTGTAGANDWYEITGVQLEIAASVSAYSPNCSTQAAEIAACQRYYYRLGGASYASLGNAVMTSTTIAQSYVGFPQLMRTAPTLNTTGTAGDYRVANATAFTCTAVPILTDATFTSPSGCTVQYASTGMTAASGAYVNLVNNINAFLAFSAEL